VSSFADGSDATRADSDLTGHDLVLLDLMLPGASGFEVCRWIRERSGVPIIVLSARSDPSDIVRGLELGADDYVTKPFDPSILVARVRAVLRRNTGPSGNSARVAVRDILVDEDAACAYRGGTPLRLSLIEFRLLAELVRRAGSVLTRDQLLERVWGYDYLGDSRLVDMAVMRLREKMGPAADDTSYISTVRGVGYRFEP
jgi:two-component system response regulator RegX3